jgi:phospholipid/cholesterol/gamma-HCH transport system permease protein
MSAFSLGSIVRLVDKPLRQLGAQVAFYGKSYGYAARTLRDYRKEVVRQIGALTFGSGSMAAVGGSAAVVAFINTMTGPEVVTQGYVALNNVGVEVLTGFFAAFANIRIVIPVIAAVALIATVGAGITAELGARRISEEIDALEVMSVRPIPYLVTTRIIAGLLAITPLYTIALLVAFVTGELTAIHIYGLSSGAYRHYFTTFLVPSDVAFSYIQALAMSVVIISIHCYYGFTASGGPAGVGLAVGRSVRLSLVLVMFTLFALTLALYGHNESVRVSR